MVLEPQGNNADLNSKLTIQPATAEDTKAISSILTQSFYNFPDLVNWVYPFCDLPSMKICAIVCVLILHSIAAW